MAYFYLLLDLKEFISIWSDESKRLILDYYFLR